MPIYKRITVPVSQLVPTKPAAQVHLKVPPSTAHVPLFWQGLGEHGSITQTNNVSTQYPSHLAFDIKRTDAI